ncbi:MAG: glycosyltransferase family 4 protein [Candidatus Paceibacteria bacterium]
MNIGVDIRSLMPKNLSGVGEYTRGLVDNLIKHHPNHNYFLFCNCFSRADLPSWNQDCVDIIKTSYPNKVFSFTSSVFKRPKIDHIITSQADIDNLDVFFSPNLSFGSVTDNVKFVQTIHDLSFKFYPEFLTLKRRLWHKAVRPEHKMRRADLVLAPSENTARDIEQVFGSSLNLKVLEPGVRSKIEVGPNAQKHTAEKYSLFDNFIFFLGTLEPRKNVSGLIEAFQDSNIQDDYHLVLAGAEGWKTNKINQNIDSSPKVSFLCYVSQKEKKALLNLAELFVYPSFYEGFGFPVLEAMAGSTPVITSDRSSLAEVSGNAAYLIDPRNKTEISTGIERLLKNPKLYNEYVQRGLKQVEQYSWNSAADKFINYCSQI